MKVFVPKSRPPAKLIIERVGTEGLVFLFFTNSIRKFSSIFVPSYFEREMNPAKKEGDTMKWEFIWSLHALIIQIIKVMVVLTIVLMASFIFGDTLIGKIVTASWSILFLMSMITSTIVFLGLGKRGN